MKSPEPRLIVPVIGRTVCLTVTGHTAGQVPRLLWSHSKRRRRLPSAGAEHRRNYLIVTERMSSLPND